MLDFNTPCPSCQRINRVPVDRVSDLATCGKCKSYLFDGMPIEGTEKNIDALLQSKQPVVIDFWAPWCNPCVGFSPIFSDVAKERITHVRFVKINTETQQSLGAKYQIRSIPTIMVFKGGRQVDVMNGAMPKSQFDQWLNQSLAK